MAKPVYIAQSSSEVGEMRLRSFLHTLTEELYEKELFLRFNSNAERAFAVQRLSERAAKRARFYKPELHDRAMDDFKNLNESLLQRSVALDFDIASDARLFIRLALERFTGDYTSTPQSSLSLGLLLSLWRFGPGASARTRFTHFADKIRLDKGSVTKRALPYARLLRQIDPHLAGFDASNGVVDYFTVVRGSSLSSVPKNEDTNRTIATEPLWNMALQLAAGAYVEGALRRVGLDIQTQSEINKHLAEVGSTDGSLATIDLKSASDLITPCLIETLWPAEWYNLLMAFRSPEVCIKGEWVTANMMSTMGNGFTFPVMTLTILALVYASQSHRNKKPMYWDRNTTAVFGDDIICPEEDYDRVSQSLCQAGLIVNHDKSYASGPFRESCGGDYFMGYNVTPFYVKSLLNDAEVYITLNALLEWSARHNVGLPRTRSALLAMLNRGPFLVPFWESPFSGIRTKTVTRRYRALVAVKRPRRLDLESVNPWIAMKMVLGGYVTSGKGSTVSYMPRPRMDSGQRYVVEQFRLPRGYTDGFDPGKDLKVQEYIDLTVMVDLASCLDKTSTSP